MTGFDIHNPWNIDDRLPGGLTKVSLITEKDTSASIYLDDRLVYSLPADKVAEHFGLLAAIAEGLANHFSTVLDKIDRSVSDSVQTASLN